MCGMRIIFSTTFTIAIIKVPETVNLTPFIPSELKNHAKIEYQVTSTAAIANNSINGNCIGYFFPKNCKIMNSLINVVGIPKISKYGIIFLSLLYTNFLSSIFDAVGKKTVVNIPENNPITANDA